MTLKMISQSLFLLEVSYHCLDKTHLACHLRLIQKMMKQANRQWDHLNLEEEVINKLLKILLRKLKINILIELIKLILINIIFQWNYFKCSISILISLIEMFFISELFISSSITPFITLCYSYSERSVSIQTNAPSINVILSSPSIRYLT